MHTHLIAVLRTAVRQARAARIARMGVTARPTPSRTRNARRTRVTAPKGF
jgi:hypothetical protein